MRRRVFCAGIGALLLVLASTVTMPAPALAQASGTGAPSDHLVLPAPLPTAGSPGTIEVVEVFWYGCPHCFRLETPLRHWIARQPADVRVRRLPAVLTESWRPAARLHYTLEALGRLDALHPEVFEAEHGKRSLQVQSREVETFADWAAKHGVQRQAFIDAWNSPAVAARVDEAARLTLPLKRIGVPAIVVDGRLLTTASLTGSHDALLDTADRLIAQVRSERAASGAAAPRQ
jgi:protein dithiol oxidoreductase (disulfide-forming)